MQTKLTLRLEDDLIEQAKIYARQKGTSLSKVVADYFRILNKDIKHTKKISPITASLRGILKGKSVDESDYRKYLEEKYR